MSRRASGRRLKGVQAGSEEPLFRRLPQRILHDLSRSNTESALLWNRIYACATPRVNLADLLGLPRLWGPAASPIEDELEPYYWGFNLEGKRLPGLDQALGAVDGAGKPSEVDLFLLGSSQLILVEAKTGARPGTCSRYADGRCPEIHVEQEPAEPCRYWELDPARFDRWLDFGPRPEPETPAPPCDRHYQLARTLLVGKRLASLLERTMHLWLLIPQGRWTALERGWLDFAERVREAEDWRRLRVISWEAFESLPASS